MYGFASSLYSLKSNGTIQETVESAGWDGIVFFIQREIYSELDI